MRRVSRVLLFACLAGAASLPAEAHRGHDAISVITIAANRTLTVSHRFEASDIEPALGDIAPRAQPSLDDPEAVTALVAYLKGHFTLSTELGPVRLAPGKVDLGASEVRVAFTGTVPRNARRLTIRSDLLGGIYPGQVNQVNVVAGTTTRTMAMVPGGVESISIAPGAAPRPRPRNPR